MKLRINTDFHGYEQLLTGQQDKKERWDSVLFFKKRITHYAGYVFRKDEAG